MKKYFPLLLLLLVGCTVSVTKNQESENEEIIESMIGKYLDEFFNKIKV